MAYDCATKKVVIYNLGDIELIKQDVAAGVCGSDEFPLDEIDKAMAKDDVIILDGEDGWQDVFLPFDESIEEDEGLLKSWVL